MPRLTVLALSLLTLSTGFAIAVDAKPFFGALRKVIDPGELVSLGWKVPKGSSCTIKDLNTGIITKIAEEWASRPFNPERSTTYELFCLETGLRLTETIKVQNPYEKAISQFGTAVGTAFHIVFDVTIVRYTINTLTKCGVLPWLEKRPKWDLGIFIAAVAFTIGSQSLL